jgi:Tetratricopeptide repeat
MPERDRQDAKHPANLSDTLSQAATGGPEGKTFWIFACLLLAAVTAAYANHFFNGFHFDDFHTIVNNSYIQSLRNIPRFFADGTTFSSLPSNQSYRPLVSASLAIDYFFGKGNIFFFHLSTFLLFLLQGVVMYALFLTIFDHSERSPANRFVALTAVAWYLLHPANAETINYIIARSESLSTLLILLAFVIYVHWDFGKRWHLYLIPFGLSCLAKPIGAIFVPLFFLYIYCFEENSGSRLSRLAASLKKTAPSLIFCLLLLIFIKRMDPPTWKAGGASFFHYVITQPYVLLHYFTTFFAPFYLSADTDWTPLPSLFDFRFLIGALFLAGLIVLAVKTAKSKRLRPISFGLLWFLVTLLPTSLIPLAEVMNDHRIFLPYVGLVISVSWAAHLVLADAYSRFESKKQFQRVTVALILAALAAYGYGTHVRNQVWRSEETLWRDVTIKSPRNGRGLMNYGLTFMARGDSPEAEKYFLKAMKFVPTYPNLYVNLGILKAATGNTKQAELYYLKAIILDPRWPDGYYWYADFLYKQKRYDEAARYAQKTLQLATAHLNARKLLLSIYLESGRLTELKALAEQTLRLAPGDKKIAAYLIAGEKKRAEDNLHNARFKQGHETQ